MDNISLDASNFSDQLGIYDFFNILISGAVLVLGICTIHDGIYHALWDNVDIPKGLVIVVLIYIAGLVLQELGSVIDNYLLKVYKGMSRDFLKSSFDRKRGKITSNRVISNPLLLKHYRKLSDQLQANQPENIGNYEDDDVNRYMFSICQYYVAATGKDKKVEKMRGLFGMSKSLMATFFTLLIINLIIAAFVRAGCCAASILLPITRWDVSVILLFLTLLFYYRMRKTMRYMLLILFGTYDACLRLLSNAETSQTD